MKKKIKVGAIQMNIKPNDVESNLNSAAQLMNSLFKENCDLVVFPEDCITGPIPYRLDLVQNVDSESIQFFKKLAVQYNTYIVCGSFIKKAGDNYFNTSLLINNSGEVVLEYKKNNLWKRERRYLTSGSDVHVVKTPIGNIGIIICWDLAFPEICRRLTKLGADIICCPSYWTVDDGGALVRKYGKQTETTFVNTLCPARAIENEVLFIYANGAGKAKVTLKTKTWNSPQIGQSQICIPILGTVAKINDNSEGFILYEYDREIAKNAEKNYKIRGDLLNLN